MLSQLVVALFVAFLANLLSYAAMRVWRKFGHDGPDRWRKRWLMVGVVISLIAAGTAFALSDPSSPPPPPPPPLSPTPSPLGPEDVDVHFLTTPTVVCDGNDYIQVEFEASPLPDGYRLWAYAVPRGLPHWFPSLEPLPSGGGNYSGTVYTGPDRFYTVHILLLDENGVVETEGYIEDRKEDGEWHIGMDQQPQGSLSRAKTEIVRKCTSRYDSD